MAATLQAILFGGVRRNGIGMEVTLTLLRVFAGAALLLLHGWDKLPPNEFFINEMVAEMGFPMPTAFAWGAALSESLGGLLLALGLLTRPAALFVLGTMAVATYWHLAFSPGIAEAGWSEAFKAAENAILFGLAALVFMATGAGRFSIDAIIRRKV